MYILVHFLRGLIFFAEKLANPNTELQLGVSATVRKWASLKHRRESEKRKVQQPSTQNLTKRCRSVRKKKRGSSFFVLFCYVRCCTKPSDKRREEDGRAWFVLLLRFLRLRAGESWVIRNFGPFGPTFIWVLLGLGFIQRPNGMELTLFLLFLVFLTKKKRRCNCKFVLI